MLSVCGKNLSELARVNIVKVRISKKLNSQLVVNKHPSNAAKVNKMLKSILSYHNAGIVMDTDLLYAVLTFLI